MTQNQFTADEAYDVLNSVAIKTTGWESLLGGNQKFWYVPEDFNVSDYAFPRDSFHSFDEWGTDGEGHKVVRCWSKW